MDQGDYDLVQKGFLLLSQHLTQIADLNKEVLEMLKEIHLEIRKQSDSEITS